MSSRKFHATLLLSQLLVCSFAKINEGSFGLRLEHPEEISSLNDVVEVELSFAEYTYIGPQVTQKTRVYNGAIAGPTIRAKPGQTIKIVLKNDLPEAPINTTNFHNVCRDPDKTNMHPHGLHVSATAPGDDILIKVAAGHSYTYYHRIPEDHMGGTFWYHAHHHGSSALQAGGGGGGMIIIDDPLGALPASVAGLEEIHLLMAHLDLPYMYRWSRSCIVECTGKFARDDCEKAYSIFAAGPSYPSVAGDIQNEPQDDVYCVGSNVSESPCPDLNTILVNGDLNTILVNGMSQPLIRMVANRWYRYRMIFGAIQSSITPKLEGCEVGLLAKDGVYLATAPRKITAGFMGPGNRADWLVRCPAGSHSLVSNGLLNPGYDGPTNAARGLARQLSMVIATVVATVSGEAPCDLGTFSVARPCYLADLTGAAGGSGVAPVSTKVNVSFTYYGIAPHIDLAKEGVKPPPTNWGFNVDETLASFTTGTVNEYNVKGLWAHPFHQHVNPFQLTVTPPYDAGGYFQAGDWHDTLLMPADADAKNSVAMKLVTPTDTFTGKQVIHCHFLVHEDWGMMAIIDMPGHEGARFDVSPYLANGDKCYSSKFDPATYGPIKRSEASCSAAPPLALPVLAVQEWDAPAVTITVIAAIVLAILLIILALLVMKGAAASAPKHVQMTSVLQRSGIDRRRQRPLQGGAFA